MDISIRSWLPSGVALCTAAAVALVPSLAVEGPPHVAAPPAVAHVACPPIQLTASVQPAVSVGSLPNLLVGWLERIVVPPSAGQPLPTPQFPPAVGGTSIDSTIKNVYNAVEPWVRYGFELATYAVGWVPYVGWLSPQIMIFYNFGERIARSITFNVADWLGGHVTFVQGLVNVGRDTVNSFIQLGIDEWNFFLPPLPPLPPFPLAAKQATTPATTAGVTAKVTPTDLTPPAGTHSAAKGSLVATADTATESKKSTTPGPTTATGSSGVTAQSDTSAPGAKATGSGDAGVSGNASKGAKGTSAGGATNSSTDSAGTGGDAPAKHGKKDGTGKST